MSVPLPPRPLAAAICVTLKAGINVHRVHLSTYIGNSFNPCRGGQTRFAPISDKKGNCVPSLYAASNLESAIFETIFHDVPAGTAFKTVRKQDVTIRSHAELKVKRTLKLVNLYEPNLKKWRISRQNLIASSPKHYGLTTKWAEAIRHDFPEIEGLVWTSNRCDSERCYLFFGDKVKSTDFEITLSRDGKTDLSFLEDVRKAGERADIGISL